MVRVFSAMINISIKILALYSVAAKIKASKTGKNKLIVGNFCERNTE